MLDEQWRLHQKPVGPLHGLPVSLMDRFHVAGLDSACGYVSWLGSPKKEDDEGLLLERLRTLGAIVLCKTNVPMSSMVSRMLRLPRGLVSILTLRSHRWGRLTTTSWALL